MRPRPGGAFYITLALTVFAAALVLAAGSLPPQVRAMPYLVGMATLFLLLVLLVGEFYPSVLRFMESTMEDLWGGDSGGASRRPDPLETTPWPAACRIGAWAIGFFVFVFIFGFFLVPPIFVAAFLIVEAEVAPVKAVLSSLIANGAVFAGMAALKMDFWPGAMPEVIEGYLGGAIVPPL